MNNEQTPLRGHIVTNASANSNDDSVRSTEASDHDQHGPHNVSNTTDTTTTTASMDDTRRILIKIGIDFAIVACSE